MIHSVHDLTVLGIPCLLMFSDRRCEIQVKIDESLDERD